MKQKTFLLFAFLLCMMGSVHAQGPVKPKLCSTCGKMVVNCPYKGNHPKSQSKNNSKAQITLTSGEYVDLGLPSGTLWATKNIGASKPEELGDYYAWGETKGQTNKPSYEYSFSHYKWWEGENEFKVKIRKYNCGGTLINHGEKDNIQELEPDDDAAYVNWGTPWRMPSTKQFIELFGECKSYSITKYHGVNGCMIKGKNGKTLFLPLDNDGYGQYWSRSIKISDPTRANHLFITPNQICEYSETIRSAFLNVRPVRQQ